MYTVAIIPSSVGFHWEEVFAAYQVFKEASWNIWFYTVNGKPAVPDPNSIKKNIPLSYLGMGVRDAFSPESKLGQTLNEQLTSHVHPVEQLNVDKIDAIYIPGGHGSLFDVDINETVHAKLAEAYEKNKIIGAVCHGVSCLALTKVNGESIIKGKNVIGFLDMLDQALIKFKLIDERFLPLPYWNEKKIKEAGAVISPVNKAMAILNPTFYLTDPPFVTGLGPKSTQYVAMKMVNMAHERVA